LWGAIASSKPSREVFEHPQRLHRQKKGETPEYVQKTVPAVSIKSRNHFGATVLKNNKWGEKAHKKDRTDPADEPPKTRLHNDFRQRNRRSRGRGIDYHPSSKTGSKQREPSGIALKKMEQVYLTMETKPPTPAHEKKSIRLGNAKAEGTW